MSCANMLKVVTLLIPYLSEACAMALQASARSMPHLYTSPADAWQTLRKLGEGAASMSWDRLLNSALFHELGINPCWYVITNLEHIILQWEIGRQTARCQISVAPDASLASI